MYKPTTKAVQAGYAGAPSEGLIPSPIPLHDVRLKRELAHRRLVVSMIRRVLRVISLHLVDGVLLAGIVLLIDWVWPLAAIRELLPAIVVVFLLSLNAVGAYSSGEARRDGRRLLSGVVLGGLIFFTITALPPNVPIPWPVLALVSAAGCGALMIGRRATDELVRQAYVHGIGLRRAVVVGNLTEVGQAIHQLRDERNIDQYVVGHLAPDHEPDPAALGLLGDLPRILDEFDVQEVVLATSLAPRALRSVANACFQRGTLLYVFPSVLGSVDCRVEPMYVGPCPLMHLTPARVELPALLVKRCFDLTLAALLLIIAIPMMLVIAAAIRLDTRGPAFFRQRRVGLGGRDFTMWKFRSMYVDSEGQREGLARLNSYGDGRLFKLETDPRITRVGRLLRRTSLDELPQLFNVIRGEMSLVGPRPPLRSEVASYEPHHFERLTVVPGMTGPWQVNGRNLITDFEKVVRMERAYIRSWSLLLDAKILLRTIKVVINGEGAY